MYLPVVDWDERESYEWFEAGLDVRANCEHSAAEMDVRGSSAP